MVGFQRLNQQNTATGTGGAGKFVAIIVDYHTHTNFSPDSKYSMAAMCAAAVAAGVSEIAFTDHADFDPAGEAVSYLDLPTYMESLRKYQFEYSGRLTIRAGVELGDPHNYSSQHRELLETNGFDFVIGSLHWVNGRCTCRATFFAGQDPGDAYSEYFDAALTAADRGEFDVLGHLDVPKRRGEQFAARFDPFQYEDQIREVLRKLVAKGRGIEINASGLRSPAAETCPSLPVVRWFHEEHGEIVTVSSDAHNPGQIGLGADVALAILRAAGFRYLATFEQRKPIFIAI